MFILALADMVISLLDVVFLAGLLLLISFYTHGLAPVHNTFITQFLASQNPLLITGGFLLLYALKNVAGVWLMKRQHAFVYGVASRLSKRNLLRYLRGSYMEFVHVDSSVRMRQIGHIPIEFAQYVLTGLQQIIAQALLILFTICAILLYHPGLFLLLFLILTPPVALLGRYIKRRVGHLRKEIKTNNARNIQYLQEALAGYVESNIYDKNDFFVNRYMESQQRLNYNLSKQQTLQGLSSRLMELFALGGFFILIAVNHWSGSGVIDVMTIGVFMAAAYKIIPGIVKILNSAGQIKTYSFTLTELNFEEHAPADEQMQPEIQSVIFRDVSFKYQDDTVLNKLNFRLAQGDLAGISGVSGKGKTTLINLLLGFLEQHNGEISINSLPADTDTRKAFWKRIAYVKQQGFFINDTIRANITLKESHSDEVRLQQVIKLCGLDVLLQNDAEGIDKQLRENGKNISGGQRQRIMLARALYHDFDLLILDEPFSEMDEAAEHSILSQLKEALAGKMMLFITHNKKSLSFCNQIISLDAA